MKDASSSYISDVTTTPTVNKELPHAKKTAQNPSKKTQTVTCTEVHDIDNINHLKNYLSTPNEELLLHIDNKSPTSLNDTPPTTVNTPTNLSLNEIIHILSLDNPSPSIITRILQNWAHESRLSEINENLVKTLIDISQTLASKIILQLKEPRATLRNVNIGEYKDKSLVVQAKLNSLDNKISVIDDLALVDCGAGGRGYISSKFVDLHNLPCTPLPYHIPIYNVDGTQNKAGAISRLCTLKMQIGGHSEQITFRVTETGSSNIILGLEWLKIHDPLVNWSKGKLFFINCPSQCGLESTGLCVGSSPPNPPSTETPPTPLEDLGPDTDFARSILDCTTDNDLMATWHHALSQELGTDDESLLCVDLSSKFPILPGRHEDNRISDYLRQTKDNSNSIDKYLKDFAPVFSQSGFDDQRSCSLASPTPQQPFKT